MSSWVIFILGAMIAGFVQGLTGFAFALIAMSFWIWILPPQLSAPLVVFASLWCHIISISKEPKSQINTPLVSVYIIAGLIGVPLGTFLLHWINADIFKLIVGIFLIIWCPIMFSNPNFSHIKKLGKPVDAIIGFIGGVLGGLGGFCGAVPSAWVMLKQLPKQDQRNILRHFNFAVQLFTLVIYLINQTLNFSHLNYLIVILCAVSIPAILGAHFFYKISESLFKYIVLSLLFLSGCMLTATSLLS